MANFTVNIDAELTPQYTVTANKLYSEDDCAVLNEERALGLIKTTNTYDMYYLLTDYIDASSWKTLKIKNIVYSNTTGFYLSDTLVKIPEAGATVYDFDITGQAVDIPIANLTVTFDTLTLTQNETIEFDLAIENLVPTIGAYTSVKITLKHVICAPVEPVVELTITNEDDTSCFTKADVNVKVPAEGSRYVTVTPDTAYGAPTVAGTTITVNTTYNLIIDRATGGPGSPILSRVILRVYEDSSQTTSIASHRISRTHGTAVC